MLQDRLYYMMNKPQGCITARKDTLQKTVMEYFPQELADVLFPVGRLDKDTEGLLLFTNDGQFDQKLMHPKHHAPKKYYLFATGELGSEAIDRIEGGQLLTGEDKPTKGAAMTITERGRYEDFEKRMMLAEGCRVIYLKRLEIGGVKLDDSLKPGEYRKLTEAEYDRLMSGDWKN